MPLITDDLVRLYVESDALGLAELVRKRQVSPLELSDVAISLIEQTDAALNAVVIRSFEMGRKMAREASGDGIFAGVPFLLKNIGSLCKGMPMTNGLAYLSRHVCDEDSELVRRIKASGLIPLGRTNVPENGWCIATEPKFYGPTLNPWNTEVTPGGSSGGAAAAVAARMVPLAEGTDGGGSIRVPASCCGLVGLKPSRGRITYGPQTVDIWFGSVYFFALSRTVRDTAAFLDATAGNLPGDPYRLPTPATPWLSMLDERPRCLRIGYTLKAPWGAPFALEVVTAIRETVTLLEALGHDLLPYDMTTDLEAAWHSYNNINSVQTVIDFDNYAGLVGRPVEQADLVAFNWAMLERGRTLSAVQHAAAANHIRKAGQQIHMELDQFDVFLTPTLTQPPRPVGYWDMNEPDFDRYNALWSDAAFMFAFNISGLPAMSVPAIWTDQDVPIGVQLVARYGDETTILHLASQLEESRPWAGRKPQIRAGG
jgi:amidase